MITEENWVNFIQTFFGASNAPAEWIHHVAAGWNHNKNEAGCHCSYTWYSGPVECDVYTGIRDAKEQFELANTSDIPIYEDDIKPVDLAGVENYIERGHDGDFYEVDEPVKDVVAAFEGGEHGTTGRSLPTEDYLDALKPNDTQILSSLIETGAHPKLKDLVAEYKATTKSGTSGGVELTDDVVNQLADEAEDGYDPKTLRPYTETDIKAITEYMEAFGPSDEAQAVEDFEEDGPGHGYWEKGDH